VRDEELERVVQAVLDAHPNEVKAYKAARKRIVGSLVGQTLRANKNLNPEMVSLAVKVLLEEMPG
jgi:Asp-tRNA(Asn)/Glu-tRNA(Gln) amidotransferase B subunit